MTNVPARARGSKACWQISVPKKSPIVLRTVKSQYRANSARRIMSLTRQIFKNNPDKALIKRPGRFGNIQREGRNINLESAAARALHLIAANHDAGTGPQRTARRILK